MKPLILNYNVLEDFLAQHEVSYASTSSIAGKRADLRIGWRDGKTHFRVVKQEESGSFKVLYAGYELEVAIEKFNKESK